MFPGKKPSHLATGQRGERAALWHLRLRGYRILDRNYRCPSGEIDIVARKGGVTVFVEVRTRRDGSLVDPIGSIGDLKLAHMVDAAGHYLLVRGLTGRFCRFDIISVRPGGPFRNRIQHYPDAFRITDERPARGARVKRWIRRQPRPGGSNSRIEKS